MKNLIVCGILSAALAVSGCAKSEKTSPNADEQRYVEAWIQVRHPEAEMTSLGTYMLSDTPGTGDAFEGHDFVMVEYTVTDLEGTVTSTTSMKMAQQIGSYDKSYYYGPAVWPTYDSSLPVGIEDMLKGMKVGGTRTSVIPAWLMGYDRYKNPSDYLKHSTDNSTAIYSVTLTGVSDDILKTQIDSMEVYAAKHLESVDSTSYGFYYKQLKEPKDTLAFPSDTSIYINYIGRLLNGQVFDTTIKDTAKFYNIYSSSSTYEPVKVSWGESVSDLKLYSDSSSDGSSVITGFALTLWQMHKYEKGAGMFFSPYGYGTSGSGKAIPGYAPLVFEIEIVDEP